MISLNMIPEAALLEVLCAVPAHDLILRCRPVCTLWRDIIDSPALWKMKSHRDGLVHRRYLRIPPDWRMFYFLHLKKRNLLKNPCATDGLESGWEIEENGGAGWKIEEVLGDHGRDHPDQTLKHYFVTLCRVPGTKIRPFRTFWKHQLIDLEKEGYPGEWIDCMQPDILIEDWYAARKALRSLYGIAVQLMSKDHTVLKEILPGDVVIDEESDASWIQVQHRFRNYGPGVRYVRFSHGARGRMFGSSPYGISLTGSSVVLDPGDLSV